MTCEKNKMARDFSAVLDIPKTLEVSTSKIDYTLNISFRSGNFQWLKVPKSNAGLECTIELQGNDAAEEFGSTRAIAYVEGDAIA